MIYSIKIPKGNAHTAVAFSFKVNLFFPYVFSF